MTATVNVADRVVLDIPIDQVRPDPDNVRRGLGDSDKLQELAASVAAQGVLELLLVTPDEQDGVQTWTVVCGHRRLAAAKLAKLATVPCEVRAGMTPAQRLEAQVVENLQRADLTPIEEARAFKRLVELGVTQRKLVPKVGRSQAHISKRLKLLALPDKVLDDVDTGKISVDHALELVPLVAHPKLIPVALESFRMNRNRWTLRETVARTVAGQKKFEEREAKIVELQTAGVRVLPFPTDGGMYDFKGGKAITYQCPQRWKYYAINVAKKLLETNGHLAATVDREANVIWICTKPSAYEKTASSGSSSGPSKASIERAEAKERAEKAAKREAAKQRRVAATERLPYLTDVARCGWGSHPQHGPLAQMVSARLVLECSTMAEQRIAIEILQLPVDDKDGYRKEHDALCRAAETKPAEVGAAVAIAQIERWLREGGDEWTDVGKVSRRLFYEVLCAAGYRPTTTWERELLGLVDVGVDVAKAS